MTTDPVVQVQTPQPAPAAPAVSSKTTAIILTAAITFIATALIVGIVSYSLGRKSLGANSQTEVPLTKTSPTEISPITADTPKQAMATAAPIPDGAITLTLSEKKRIPSAEAAGLYGTEGKDIVLLTFDLLAGADCDKGCSTKYVQGFQQDYSLATVAGAIKTIGRETHIPIITSQDEVVTLFPGQTMKRQAYFFVNPEDHDFVFRYIGSAFTPSEPMYAFSL